MNDKCKKCEFYSGTFGCIFFLDYRLCNPVEIAKEIEEGENNE